MQRTYAVGLIARDRQGAEIHRRLFWNAKHEMFSHVSTQYDDANEARRIVSHFTANNVRCELVVIETETIVRTRMRSVT